MNWVDINYIILSNNYITKESFTKKLGFFKKRLKLIPLTLNILVGWFLTVKSHQCVTDLLPYIPRWNSH